MITVKYVCINFGCFKYNGRKCMETGESEIALKEGISEYVSTSLELNG